MTFQDFAIVVELVFLILIWLDGRKVLQLTERQTEIGEASLKAQVEYLSLRRKWYEQRNKKKVDVVPGNPPNASSNT